MIVILLKTVWFLIVLICKDRAIFALQINYHQLPVVAHWAGDHSWCS